MPKVYQLAIQLVNSSVSQSLSQKKTKTDPTVVEKIFFCDLTRYTPGISLSSIFIVSYSIFLPKTLKFYIIRLERPLSSL